jgi:hypothetical protein
MTYSSIGGRGSGVGSRDLTAAIKGNSGPAPFFLFFFACLCFLIDVSTAALHQCPAEIWGALGSLIQHLCTWPRLASHLQWSAALLATGAMIRRHDTKDTALRSALQGSGLCAGTNEPTNSVRSPE